MGKKQTEEKKEYTRFVSRECIAGLGSGSTFRSTFLDDALARIAELGRGIRLEGSRVFVTFGANMYEIVGASGLAEMLEGISYPGVPTAGNIGIEAVSDRNMG